MDFSNTIYVKEEDLIQISRKYYSGEMKTYINFNWNELSVVMTDNKSEKLYELLDEELHDTTYSQLDEENSLLRVDKERLEEENEQLREMLRERKII